MVWTGYVNRYINNIYSICRGMGLRQLKKEQLLLSEIRLLYVKGFMSLGFGSFVLLCPIFNAYLVKNLIMLVFQLIQALFYHLKL